MRIQKKVRDKKTFRISLFIFFSISIDRLYVTRTVWEFMMAEGHPLPVLAPSLERADQEREAKNSQEKRNETQ